MKDDGPLPFELLGNGIRCLFLSIGGIQVTLGYRTPRAISCGISVLLLWTVSPTPALSKDTPFAIGESPSHL